MDDTHSQQPEDELYKLRLMVPQLKMMADEYKHSEKKLKALYQISELSTQVKTLSDLYPSLHKIISTFINADNFYIGLLDKVKGNFEFAYCVDMHDSEMTARVVPFEDIASGVTAYMLGKEKPLLLRSEDIDNLNDAGHIKLLGVKPLDWLGTPLVRNDDVFGAVVVQSYDSKVRYSNKDKELLNFVAQHIVIAIERVRQRHILLAEIEERTQKLANTAASLQIEINQRKSAQKLQGALIQIAELANQETNLDDFYKRIHLLLSQFINTENYYIALHDKERGKLVFPYFVDQFNSEIKERNFTNGLTEHVIKQNKPVLLDSDGITALEKSNKVCEKLLASSNKRALSWLGCPLKVANKIIGIINVQSYREDVAYNEQDLQLLKFASHHIAQAIAAKLAAENLIEHQNQLEEKIKQRTADLQNANDSLKHQIAERKKVEEQLYHDAHHDALTGLPNRLFFQNSIKRAVAHKRRDDASRYSVMFIDLDRFKVINDTLGHHAGDEFLKEVSQRIQSCIRDHDLLARLGGDEFIILLTAFESEDDCEEVASRIIESVAKPFQLEGQTVFSGASIGIAIVHGHYETEEEVMRDADAAMYHAKGMGRGRFIMFDRSMHQQLVEDMEMEVLLRRAIDEREIELFFEPIKQLNSNETVGYESLVRWQHPELGQLEFEQFIKIAEDAGLAANLCLQVIEQSCELLKQWQCSTGYEKHYNIHINISNAHLTQPRLIKNIIEVIKNSTVVPYHLVLEIDENGLSKNAEEAYKGIKALKKIGVKLALDNFGSGIASLNYLYNYPFDFVKIDRRFVGSLNKSSKHFMLITSAQAVAEHVGFKLIAQGIESIQQADQLMKINCEFGQGQLIGAAKKLIRLSESESDIKRA